MWKKLCTTDMSKLVFKKRKYLGIAAFVTNIKKVMKAISSGKMKWEGVVTKRFKVDEGG